METVRTLDEANAVNAARKLTLAGNNALQSALVGAIRDSKILTEDQVDKLELCSTFATQHYVIFLINDTSGNEPVGVLWAYAEILNDDSGFLFSYGAGNSKTDMKIRACSMLAFDSRKKRTAYKFGGELKDDQGEISFKIELTSEQFASQITEIVNVDGGGRKRLAIASTEDRLTEVMSSESPAEAADLFDNDDGEGA